MPNIEQNCIPNLLERVTPWVRTSRFLEGFDGHTPTKVGSVRSLASDAKRDLRGYAICGLLRNSSAIGIEDHGEDDDTAGNHLPYEIPDTDQDKAVREDTD